MVSVITSVGHTDTKFYYQCGVLIDSTNGATLWSKVQAQTKLTLILTLTLTQTLTLNLTKP